jgi:hypothetical protein
MSNKLEDLGWPEATLFDMTFQNGTLSFSMKDILSYVPVKFEIVHVSISDIEALRIELKPYINGNYEAEFFPIEIGNITDDDEGFEGVLRENQITDIEAEYFWITGDLRAKTIEIERTGNFIYQERKD